FEKWQIDTETAIFQIFPKRPDHLERFRSICSRVMMQQSKELFLTRIANLSNMLYSLMAEVQTYWHENGSSENPDGMQLNQGSAPEDRRKVFVVHGRNAALRNAMFTFLSAIHLIPLEFEEARAATGQTNPYVGDILNKALSMAQA